MVETPTEFSRKSFHTIPRGSAEPPNFRIFGERSFVKFCVKCVLDN